MVRKYAKCVCVCNSPQQGGETSFTKAKLTQIAWLTMLYGDYNYSNCGGFQKWGILKTSKTMDFNTKNGLMTWMIWG